MKASSGNIEHSVIGSTCRLLVSSPDYTSAVGFVGGGTTHSKQQ